MYQPSTTSGIPLNCNLFNSYLLHVKQFLHAICIPKNELKTCGGGQPFL